MRRAWPAVLVAVALAACTPATDGGPVTTPPASSPPDPASATSGPAPMPPDARGRTHPGPSPTAPGTDTGVGGLPSADLLEAARADVAALDLEALAGQLVVASYSGSAPQDAARAVSELSLGGLITLGGNVPDEPDQRVDRLGLLADAVSAAVADGGRDWPAFLGIDQEGGPITRVGAPLTAWPSAMALGAAERPDLSADVGRTSGRELRALGYTVVFAPVADVTTGPDDPTIGARSPGSDPRRVAETALALASGYQQAGIVPVLKHFPGHGSVPADSHVEAAVQEADLTTLRARDLVPFAAAVQQGAPAVMTAHIVVEALEDRPATVSREVLTGLLREALGFTGLVVTDALNMAAVADRYDSGGAAVAAVRAGADVLLMPQDPAAAVAALVAEVEEGGLDRERLEESAARMVATLRHHASVDTPGSAAIGAGDDLALTAARAAVTQLGGRCGRPLVGDAVRVVGGTERDRRLFTEAARAEGLRTGAGSVVALLGGPTYQAGGGEGGAAVAGPVDVAVALDVPYGLAELPRDTVGVAVYGRTPATFTALLDVLVGDADAPGSLPVAVGRLPVGTGCR